MNTLEDAISAEINGTNRYRGRAPKVPSTFNVGDRVTLKRKPNPKKKPMFPRTHGIVVRRHGEHDPENPRVRWADGWGTNIEAHQLRLLTVEEMQQPPPATYQGDALV